MEQYRLLPDPDAELAEEAILHYERPRELARNTEDSASALAHAHAALNLCDALIQVGELQRAVEVCDAVVAASPDDPVAHYNLAGVYAQLGRTDEALASLERDLALGDHDFRYLESDPWFASTQDDPRLRDLLERMKSAAASEE